MSHYAHWAWLKCCMLHCHSLLGWTQDFLISMILHQMWTVWTLIQTTSLCKYQHFWFMFCRTPCVYPWGVEVKLSGHHYMLLRNLLPPSWGSNQKMQAVRLSEVCLTDILCRFFNFFHIIFGTCFLCNLYVGLGAHQHHRLYVSLFYFQNYRYTVQCTVDYPG